MANFQTGTGARTSGKNIPVRTATFQVGLWGCMDGNGRELKVVAVDPFGNGSRVAGVNASPGALSGNVRTWTIESSVGAKVRLEARVADGTAWDWMELTFTGQQPTPGTDADRQAVLDAVKAGRILGETAPLRAVCTSGVYDTPKGPLTMAAPMFAVLAALAEDSILNLMSLMRYGQGPHGKIQPDGSAICTAMDIQKFGAFPINLIKGENVDNTISGIAAVIDALPNGTYAVGLTRPSLRAGGPPMPDKDVFLPVKTPADIYKVGTPLANPTPQFVQAKAADAINRALMLNPGARMNRMFQDGPDHMHLEVIQATR